jgi:flap endonuclease-1
MGIRYLNQFFRENCKKSINQIPLSNLRNKKIVIDISIYIYKYLSEDALLENIYLMIYTLKELNIRPLFVFDGIPPKEKRNELNQRRVAKQNAELEYKNLQNKMQEEDDKEKIKDLQDKIFKLKKECVKINNNDICNVKDLITSCGCNYIVAEGEADQLCAYLVVNDFASVCISEDMDLFVYGCPKVLRYFNVLNKTGVLYDYKSILSELKITHDELQSICVLSGTDYNNENKINLNDVLNLFKKYAKKNITEESFCDWFIENYNFENELIIDDILRIKQLFNVKNLTPECGRINFKYNIEDKKSIQFLLADEGFIFPNSH